MATLDDFNRKLVDLENALVEAGPKIAEEMAINQLTMARDRIERRGIPGKKYSTTPMLATINMFSIRAKFKPTVIASELGRGDDGRLVRGGKRDKTGAIAKRGAKARERWLWIRFKNAKKAVPVMILPGGYSELRTLNGRQVKHVDLSFFGRMWQNTKLVDRKTKGFKYLAIIGATTKEDRAKLAGNFARYGDFLAPTPEELKVLQEIQRNRLTEIFKKILG